jgi:tryptophan halogenase
MNKPIQKMVIAGGGTAGWMAAALLRKVLPAHVAIELVESEQIGIVGVGEATIPPIQIFNRFVNLDERAFLRETNATIKLAIRFENWRKPGESYYHTFGAPGANLGFCAFQHHWLRAQKMGLPGSLWDYDLHYLACEKGVFNKLKTDSPVHELGYAYHFDSALYGQFLRRMAEGDGVTRTGSTGL